MDLKKRLDYHYRYFDFDKISPDPLEFPHRFHERTDIEISAFIASVFAYGNVKQIISTLEKIHKVMGVSPFDFVMDFKLTSGRKLLKGIKHRFYNEEDILTFFYTLKKVYENYGSLNYLFLLYYFPKEEFLKSSLSCFSKNLLHLSEGRRNVSDGLKFMFPDPFKGSACKRMNLFLRWMIRKDDLDFGLWKEIPSSQLVIPVDTHVARICKELRLTKLKNVSWQMAEDITKKLKKYNSEDPVKYDFAICHIGMRKMKF
jgi:uncharacterized protein (TIGR02757 family)